MTTKRIYQEDQYAVSCEAEVTGVRTSEGFDVIACDRSVFFPAGGGQPSDTGTAALLKAAGAAGGGDGVGDDAAAGGGSGAGGGDAAACGSGVGGDMAAGAAAFEVVAAYDEGLEGDVWHVTDAPAGTFSAGDTVLLTIDWDRRFRNMQRHLGEHMLSGTFHTLFGGVNRGFHMGEEYITIDIDLGGDMLSDEDLDLAERTVNDAIWADLPVTVSWFDDYESSLVMPVRKQVPHDGRVSVVTVGDAGDPYDCIACCGTHPARSSEVGLLSIYKCEPNKGMNRIFFDCGAAALEKLSGDSRALGAISKAYSCGPHDLAARLQLEKEEVSALKGRLASLASYVKEAEKKKILEETSTLSSADTVKAYIYRSDLLTADELLKLGFSVISETEGVLLLIGCEESLTCLLFSSAEEVSCGGMVREFAPEFGGRGGGRDDNARAVFPDISQMKGFMSRVSSEADKK